jgi:antitoxin component of RelBE/YafQ-DinJ toxin-antitoxin module
MTVSRTETVRVRVSAQELERAQRLADKLGGSVSSIFRQAVSRLYDDLFPDRSNPAPRR